MELRPMLLRGAAVSTAVLLSAVSLPTGANATHGRVFYNLSVNTAAWKVCVSGWTAGQNASLYAIGQISATDVNATSVHCPSGYNLSSTAASYPDAWFGITSCSRPSGSRCASTSVRLNGRTITTTAQWRKSALHEFGHAAGLGHRDVNTSCMTQGEAPPIVGTLDAHDKASINANY